MFSLCSGGDAEDEEARPEPEDPSESGYRPARMARELIDEAAMSPTGQVELPRGVARSNFTSSSARTHAALSAGSAALAFSASNAVGFGRGAGDGEAGAQAEILGEELKKEGNQLYNEGQLEAAELVYTEALKARGYSPKNHVIYSNRSMCYGKQGKYADALADAKTVVAMMPTWAKGFARLAAALEASSLDAEAVAAYDKARWLAQAHDNDPQGEEEYAAAGRALRLRASSGCGEEAYM